MSVVSDKNADDLLKELKELRTELTDFRKERSSMESTLRWIGRLAIVLIVLVIFMIVARIVGWVLHNLVLIGVVTVAIILLWMVFRKKK
jgi:Na+/melibiose symporter-like transporter